MVAFSFSYASFTRTATRAGGWGVGEVKGEVSRSVIAELTPLIPVVLADDHEIPNYPTKKELAELTRRFAWLPAPGNPEDRVFFASCQAGQDSTGRPGNVFTYVLHEPAWQRGSVEVANFLYSPQIPAPFGKKQVNSVSIPDTLTESGPVSTQMLSDFLSDKSVSNSPPQPAEPASAVNPFSSDAANYAEPSPAVCETDSVVHAGTATHSRQQLCWSVAQALDRNQPVIFSCPMPEVALWLGAIARIMSRPEALTFSTFETAQSVSRFLSLGCSLIFTPPREATAVRQQAAGLGAIVVSADGPIPHELATALEQQIPAHSEPQSPLVPEATAHASVDSAGLGATSLREDNVGTAMAPAVNPFEPKNSPAPGSSATAGLQPSSIPSTSSTPNIPPWSLARIVPLNPEELADIQQADKARWIELFFRREETEQRRWRQLLSLAPEEPGAIRLRGWTLAYLAFNNPGYFEQLHSVFGLIPDGEHDDMVQEAVSIALDWKRRGEIINEPESAQRYPLLKLVQDGVQRAQHVPQDPNPKPTFKTHKQGWS